MFPVFQLRCGRHRFQGVFQRLVGVHPNDAFTPVQGYGVLQRLQIFLRVPQPQRGFGPFVRFNRGVRFIAGGSVSHNRPFNGDAALQAVARLAVVVKDRFAFNNQFQSNGLVIEPPHRAFAQRQAGRFQRRFVCRAVVDDGDVDVREFAPGAFGPGAEQDGCGRRDILADQARHFPGPHIAPGRSLRRRVFQPSHGGVSTLSSSRQWWRFRAPLCRGKYRTGVKWYQKWRALAMVSSGGKISAPGRRRRAYAPLPARPRGHHPAL